MGIVNSLTIALSIFPFGVLAIKLEFTICEMYLSGFMVSAVAVQLCSLSLFTAGISLWAIIGTTFIINLMYLIISPYFPKL